MNDSAAETCNGAYKWLQNDPIMTSAPENVFTGPSHLRTLLFHRHATTWEQEQGFSATSTAPAQTGGQDVGLRLGLVSRESEMNRDQTKDSHFEHHKPTGQGEQDVLFRPPDQTGAHMPLTKELPTTKAMFSAGGPSFLSPQTIAQHSNAPPEDAAAAILLRGIPSDETMRDGRDCWSCSPDQAAQGGQDSLPTFEAGLLPLTGTTSWESSINSLFDDLFGNSGFDPFPPESHTNSTQPVAYAALDPMSPSNVGSYNLDGGLFTLRKFMLNDTGPMARTVNMVENTMPQSDAGSDNIGAEQLKLADSMNGAQVLAQPMVPGANAIEDPMPRSNVGSKRKEAADTASASKFIKFHSLVSTIRHWNQGFRDGKILGGVTHS